MPRGRPPKLSDLDKRIQVQSRTDTRDAAGQPQESWTSDWEQWFSLEPIRGREHVDTGAADVTYEAWARYRKNYTLTPRHRLRWVPEELRDIPIAQPDQTARFFNIEVVEVIDRYTWYWIQCKEKL